MYKICKKFDKTCSHKSEYYNNRGPSEGARTEGAVGPHNYSGGKFAFTQISIKSFLFFTWEANEQMNEWKDQHTFPQTDRQTDRLGNISDCMPDF